MIETEPEWDDQDRDWANALHDLEADKCPGCGHRLSETLLIPGQPAPKWDVGAHFCTACAKIDEVQQTQNKKDRDSKGELLPNVRPSARLWWARLRVNSKP